MTQTRQRRLAACAHLDQLWASAVDMIGPHKHRFIDIHETLTFNDEPSVPAFDALDPTIKEVVIGLGCLAIMHAIFLDHDATGEVTR
jgi:hypothetical protein